MKKTYAIAITLLAILLLLALAVFRGQMSRELILMRNGVPLANLKADVMPHNGGATIVRTSTDLNGKLDLSTLPAGTEWIAITLWDGTKSVYNGDIKLPTCGSLTLDFRGNRTICTTKRTYADFVLFKYAEQEVMDSTDMTVPPKTKSEESHPADRARPAASPPSATCK
jgi:hypothetical protein